MWKSRIDQLPSPDFWADFLANVDVIFPGAKLDQQILEQLYELVIDEWRNGRQVNLIVRQLCSCDGQHVHPSEGAKRRLEKRRGIAKAPTNALPGTIFGVDELREAGIVGKLMAKLAMVDERLQDPKKREPAIRKLLEQRQGLLAEIEAAKASAYWHKHESPPPSPWTPVTEAKIEKPKRTRKRFTPKAELQIVEKAAPQGLDPDIGDELINDLARKA